MELRVLTFNVRCGVANDGANSWPFRKDAAAQLIASQDPDVAGLQEAFDYQNADLLARLPGYGMIGVGREDGIAEGEFATLLYKEQKLKPVDSGTFWLSEQPDLAGSRAWGANICRICTWATFEEGFGVYNLHLDHQSQEAREGGVRTILERVRRDIPTIVMGDFNADEANPAAELMRQAGYRDSFRVVHPNEPEPGTWTDFKEVAHPGKIDYIWISPEWRVREASIVSDRFDGRPPSDHFAVSAILSL